MTALAKILPVFSVTALCVACGGGGSASPSASPPAPAPPPATNASPGGIWFGIDTEGVDIIAIVTEAGRFLFVNEFFDQGSGTLDVSNGNEVSADFDLVTQLGSIFDDGSTLASCDLSGTIVERQSMTVSVGCTTIGGRPFRSDVTLNYDPLYERDSSLPVIAGNYDDSGLVLNIDADGVVFEQDPATGCVTSGQITIIDAAFNAYDIELDFDNCTGQAAVLNGTNFVGMATLDNTVSPEALVVGVTGEVSGNLAALFGISERL